MVLGDIGRIELRQYRDLLNDIFHLIFCIFDIDDLDSNGLACSSVDPGLYVNAVLLRGRRDRSYPL